MAPAELTHPAYGRARRVTPFASVVLCENPGMMTLDGTNTWILRAPGASRAVVVDPGPRKHRKHLANVLDEAGEVELTLFTHRHDDHVGALKRFRKMTGAPTRAYSSDFSFDAPRLTDREVIEAAGLRITVMHTPGHTLDSTSFLVECDGHRAVLTGDTVLGSGTTVLDPRDGTLGDYFHSLNRLIVEAADVPMLPGHGPDHAELGPVARFYKQHREERLEQIRAALVELGKSPHEAKPMKVVKTVYADVDEELWPAAKMSVKAQLEYLRTL
ncbi:MBL fold metallo-hydrolase [Gordonia liuliyuniae]|uniref:MBL fold metallo-hydrolase n=1 Tax=Gordonia liuliyuniae TaxID=2911517 RepID=A0ABS9IT03_9ACTN|nr:MBL fold metallo-hydrolase [Gordonia liuliyuniae]MCF8588698.1 MBL fold metallo-hydrolase [Gordonia liuliyuniae]